MAQETTSATSTKSKATNGKWQGDKSLAADTASEASGTMDTVLSGVQEKASEYMETASGYMKSFDANPMTFIRQYPVQAAIGGVVIGFLLGTVVSRRTLAE